LDVQVFGESRVGEALVRTQGVIECGVYPCEDYTIGLDNSKYMLVGISNRSAVTDRAIITDKKCIGYKLDNTHSGNRVKTIIHNRWRRSKTRVGRF
jgi:hypothetical protein